MKEKNEFYVKHIPLRDAFDLIRHDEEVARRGDILCDTRVGPDLIRVSGSSAREWAEIVTRHLDEMSETCACRMPFEESFHAVVYVAKLKKRIAIGTRKDFENMDFEAVADYLDRDCDAD
jgi:hypothetical protein